MVNEPGFDYPVMYVTDWIPYEGSSVSVPADHTVGYLRNLQTEEGEKENMTKDINNGVDTDSEINEEVKDEVAETETTENIEAAETETKADDTEIVNSDDESKNETEETVAETETKADDPEADTETDTVTEETVEDESEEIRAAGELAGEEELAETAINEKKSLDDFKAMVKAKRNLNTKNNEGIKNMKKFSISKAIRNACSQYKADITQDYETEIIAENKRSLGMDEEYDVIVTKNQLRALAPTANNGKELITGEYLPQEFTPALRPELTLEATGYHVIPVTGPSVSFAVVTSGATAAMYDLDGQLTDSDLKFATKELKPRKEGVCVPIPYSLLLQARPEVDAIVEQDIVNALAELRDKMILVGTGSNNQPTGITATSGVNEMDIDDIKTWAGICEAEQKIRAKHDFGTLCFVMNGKNKAYFESTLKDNAGYGGYLCEDNKIKGMDVFVNNALDDNTIILGNFAQVVVADFDRIIHQS